MIDYGCFAYAAAPRTGTTWFKAACHQAGLGDGNRDGVHIPGKHTFVVTTIRHPCSWLRSYWNEIKGGAIHWEPFDSFGKLKQNDFDAFVVDYLDKMPGAIGRLFNQYNANTVIKLEDQPWAFHEFIECFGMSLKNVPPKMNSRAYDFYWSDELYREVVKAENTLIETYEYEGW